MIRLGSCGRGSFKGVALAVICASACACVNTETWSNTNEGIPINTNGMVKVYFDPNGGEWALAGVSIYESERSIPQDTPIIFPSKPPIFAGWVFIGWYYEAMPPLGPDQTPPANRLEAGLRVLSDMTVYALWQQAPANSYTVYFKEGANDPNPTVRFARKENGFCLTEEEFPSLAATPDWEPEGAWWTSPEGGVPFNADTVVDAHRSVYAHWVGKVRTLSFDLNGGSWPENPGVFAVRYPQTRLEALPTIMPRKTVTGKALAFCGWARVTESEKTPLAFLSPQVDAAAVFPVFTLDSELYEDCTVYAVWQEPPPETLPVIFTNATGEVATRYAAVADGGYRLAAKDFPPAPVRAGHTFVDWASGNFEPGAPAFTAETLIPANAPVPLLVYARWGFATYTVNYDLNYAGAPAGGSALVSYPNDTTPLPSSPARSGWDFVRWDFLPDGTGGRFTGTGVHRSLTVYALWALSPVEKRPSGLGDGGMTQVISVRQNGWYCVELWGAQGSDAELLGGAGAGGRGAYTRGNIFLDEGETVYLYMGGSAQNAGGSFNGGGAAGGSGRGSGGGATDLRTSSVAGAAGLAARIMVAAGGGGACDARWSTNNGKTGPNLCWDGGFGGGAGQGGKGAGEAGAYGGGQTQGGYSGGLGGGSGSFGAGGAPVSTRTAEMLPGGGGGWFGGGAAGHSGTNGGGGGGSSYISGWGGCVATSSAREFVARTDGTDVDRATSWTGKIFTHMELRAGNEEMPSPNGSVQIGNSGPGAGRLIYIGPTDTP